MADTRVSIDVDLNTSPAAQGLRDLQRQYNAFTSSLNKNNAAQASAARQYSDQLLRMVNSSQMFTAETVRMQTAASRLDKTLAKGQVTMGQFFSARFLRDSNAAAQVLSLANARAAALQTQFFATSAAANGMRDAIAVRPYEAFNSALAVSAQKLAIHRAMLMQATTHMINFGKNTQWAGRQLMVGFTVPLTIFGGVAGKVFRDLEEQAINFKKVYGDIFTTEAETQEALNAVKELSMEFTKYGIAVKDTMELAGVAAQSGLRNAELMAATTQATRLATLGQMEQAEAMKTIISLQTAFKTSNEGLAESVDFLNIIENQTVLALQDVAGAIPRVAPVIQGLGGDVKDLAVLLVAMKEGGVTAGEGANALKSSLGRLIVPTKRAKEMASEFGISLESIVENNRGQLLPMIMELGNAMESLGDLERQQLLTTIFGKFQYARIGALFDNITRDSSQAARAMELMSLSAADLGKIAEKELGVVEESVGARFTAAMERAKVAIAPLGEAFLNLSIPVINLVANIIEKFNQLPDFAKKFAVFGSVIVGVVIPVGTMFLGLLMNLIGTLIKFGAIIGIAFKGFTSGGIKGAVQAVSQALNYMSLEEIDAANAAQQLGQSTQIVNEALRTQVGRSAEATVGINQLGAAYASLIMRMREAAALSATQGGAFVVPGAAADIARRGPRPRGYNKGGKILKFNDGNTVPGVGNTDTVPAMLTPGEFVVNKQATKDNLGLLQQINDGQVQYRNKGGGIATPGRMFYGPKLGRPPVPTPPPSADDFLAMAAKGINPLDDTARAQAKEAGLGTTSLADDTARARAAAGQAATQLQIKRALQEYLDSIPVGITKSSKEISEDLTKILEPFGEKVTNEKVSAWMRETKGPSGRGKAHTWQKDDVSKFIKSLSFDRKTHGSHFGSPKLTKAQASELARKTTSNKVALAKELVDAGVPVTALTDDWAELSIGLNLAASRSTNKKMTILESIDDLQANKDILTLGPAMKRAGVKEEELIEDMVAYLRRYADENGADVLITDEILTAARNSAIGNKKVKPIITGARVPTQGDLQDWVASIRKIEPKSVTDSDIALELDKIGFDYIYGQGKRQRITHRATGISDEIARSSSYKTSWSDIPDVLKLAKGGLIPGMALGGPILSRAAQLRRVKDANVAGTLGLQDNALSKILKLRFNDVKGAEGPAGFVKGMFSRWETTPTRLSTKENTTMLLRGKKPKYDPIPQEDYLADMIVSMDKFSDTVDAFKPIKIGTAFDGGFRVFDGHTRLHAQTVKGLIKRFTGKDTSSMSRDEIVEGIRLVQRKSLADEITDAEIIRSAAGQRVLSTRASKREVELINERPGKQSPMASMLNREGRVLLPEIHGKEIEAIVNAAKKANFYGVKKDPESLMQAMGFISLGGGAKYRYEPGRTLPGQKERRSFVANMSRKIIDDLIDSGEILPLRRNKGGIIPGVQYRNDGGEIFESGTKTIVPGVGNTDTVPAMLTPGEFVVNKQATMQNKALLQSLNRGGKVQFLNAGNPVSDWGDFVDPNEKKKLSKKERFERSRLGRYAERRLAAGDRAGRLLALANNMDMDLQRSGIYVKELDDFKKLPEKQQYKERNLRKAEAAARRYEQAVKIWNDNGRPPPPQEVQERAQRSASGQRTGAAAGSRISANMTPGGPPATDHIYGYDPNKKPITNWNTAANLAFNNQLFDADGKRIPASQVRMVQRGTPPAPVPDPDPTPAPKVGMTRAQKIWAAISALTIAGTATGITLYERNENKQEQQGLRFNEGGRVPAMLTPGEFIVDRETATNNLELLHAINNGQRLNKGGKAAGAAKFGASMALGLPGYYLGEKAGRELGGDTGAMIGGMAGGIGASFLPYLPFGKMLPKRAVPIPPQGPTILKTTTMGTTGAAQAGAAQAGAAGKTTAKSMLASSAQFLRLSRIIPLLFNPYTALAAAVVAATYTLYKMNESNKAEYEAGRKFADAMTTTSEEISALGQTAKERAQNISSYLDQSESSFIEQKYNKKIAKAKSEREKLALKQEKREAMRKAGGDTTRRSTVRDFYNARISELASRGASDAERQNIYAQRNAALAAQRLSGINLDPKFGKGFIEGSGKEIFEEFKATRRLGMQGGANFEYAQQLAKSAYGATTSVTEAAAKDLATKLSQYVMSGVMTEDEASSVAAAISQELKDARIGQTIRNEVLSIVGADGLRAKYDPASVAIKLAERDERRLESTRQSLFELMNRFGGAGTTPTQGVLSNMAGGLIVGQGIKDIVSANRKNNQQTQIPIAQQKELLIPSFFMGDADEMRRQLGSMIELQVSQMEMLEENIAAVGLAYNDMIAKADTLRKKKDLEMEKSLAIAKLQEKQDAAREQQFAMFGGSEAWAEQAREQIDAAAFSFSNKFDAYTNSQIQDLGEAMALPVNWSDISSLGSNIVNAGKQVWEGLDAVTTQASNWFTGAIKNVGQSFQDTIFDPTGGPTFGKIYGEQSLEAVRKKYEGSAAGAALETFLQQPVIKDLSESAPETLMSLTQNMLIMGEEYSNAVMGSSMSILGAIEYAAANVDQYGTPLLDAKKQTGLQQRVAKLTSGLTISGDQALTAEGLMEITTLMGSMADDLRQGGDDLLKTFDLLETHPMFTGEQAEIATERWANFVNQTRELTEIALEDGRTLYDELIEDEQFIEVVLTDDQFFEDYLKFVEWLNKQGEDTKIAIRTEIENADDATQVVEDLVGYLADFDPQKAGKKFTDFIKQFSNLEMGSEFTEEIERITRGLKQLNKIEDPEIKAKLLAEIDPNIDLLLRLMNQLGSDPGNLDLQNQILDVAQDLNVSGRASATEKELKKKPSGGGGGGEDPLNALMRELRDSTDLLAEIGMEMLSVGREAKSIFDKLRDQGVNEVVIDYLRSMSPEDAIKVGQDLLKNEKKLNTIMQQAGEAALARQQDAKMVAESRAKFSRELLRSGPDKMGVKALTGASLMDLEAALNDPEFMEGMMAARGTAKPNKAMKEFQETYFGRKRAERRQLFNMAPAIVQSQATQNYAQTYAANQLRMRGLSEEEVQTALQSETIMNRIRDRLEQGKAIGPVITEMTKELYASTRTAMDILDDGISKVGGVFDFLAESLNNATQQIDKFTIKPLQEELEGIQDESSGYAETQRRLSRSLSNLAEEEKDLKEEQKEKEEQINDAYDLRIEALEKVDKINKDIEDRQQSQLTVADALSRGDIAAAAKAAQEMQAKAAQARREEALQAMRDQKEEDMQSLKEAHEQELEKLTVSVNGELLTREQIQEKIDELDEKIYQNSLREYDIQQKINDALDQRRKIEEQLEKVTIAQQALNQLGAINQETDIPTRQRMIENAKQTVQLIGGPEADRLMQSIDANVQGLLSADSTVIGAAMTEIVGAFGPLAGDIGANIKNLDINIPNIQTALDTAVTTATTALPNIFTGIRDQIAKLNDEIAVDPESEDNPFAKVYKAAKKVAKLIEKAFADIKPPPGSGGTGPDEPKEPGDGTARETDVEIPAAVTKNLTSREKLRSKTETITLADGRKARVTYYYGRDGVVVRNLTKYELTEASYQTGAGVQQRFTGKEFQTREDFFTAGGSALGQGIEMGLPYRIADLGGGIPIHGSVATLGQEPQSSPEWWQTGLGVAAGAAVGALTPLGPLLGAFLGGKQVNDNFKASGQYGAEGYKMGWEEYYTDEQVANEMGEAPKDAVDKGQGAQSPAEKLKPSGKYGAQGYVEGFKEYFDDKTDTILGAKIIAWFRRSMGIEGGESGATTGIGSQISSAVGSAVSNAFKTITTASLPINVASWLKRSLGIQGVSISQNIKDVGESISFGIKNGMVDWFDGKTATDIWTALQTWVHAGFGIDANGPSSKAETGIGALVSSGIKEGMKNWFSTDKTSTSVWTSFKQWIDQGFGLADDGSYSKAKPIGEGIVESIVGGMEEPQDFGPASNKFYQKLGNQFDVETSDSGLSSPRDSGRAYNIGTAILGSITKGLKDASGLEGVKGAIANAIAGPEVQKAISAAMPNISPDRLERSMYGGIIRRAFGGMISYKGSREPAPGMMMGGKVKKLAAGGFVPGIGMTDKVPALLTPGEFVVRKSVAQQMLPQLKDMNSQVFPGMGVPQRTSFNASAPQFDAIKNMNVDSVRFGVPQNINSYVYPQTNLSVHQTNMETNPVTNAIGPTNVQYNYNLSVTAKTNASADEIANSVMYKIKRFDDRRIKGTEIG